MKRIVSIVFFLLVFCALPAFAAKDTLIVANNADAKNLDPHETPDGPSVHIMVQVFETLVKVDENGQIVPYLAESFEQIDPRSFKFVLRKGVKFHSGDELKASDVVYTFKRKAQKGKINYVLGAMDLDGMQALDDHTVILRSVEPDSSFLAHLTHWGGGCILNEKATEAAGEDFGSHPVGTGPYKFMEWRKGDHITLARFDDYWGKKPDIPNVIVRTITEGTNRTIELEAKGVDIAYSILPIDIPKVVDNPDLALLRTPDTIVNYLGFNLTHKPFDDIRVRQAIAHAVNTPGIIKVVFRGVGQVATGPVSPGVRYYNKDLPAIEYDMEKAKALLREAGLEKGFQTSILTAERKERVDIATIVQSQLKKLGIEVAVNVLEWGAFQEKLKDRTHDMYLNSWTTAVPDPDYSVFGPFHSSQAKTGLNRSMVMVPEIDKLIEEGRKIPDGAEREVVYKELQRKIYDLLPWVFLQNGEQVVGANKSVKGFTPNPGGYHVLYNTHFAD